MRNILKRLASYFPERWRQELKRVHWRRQIKKGTFRSSECEFNRLEEWVRPGDWVLDIGANLGVYSLQLSKIVGPTGRVIAFEPVPQTFELLAANMAYGPYRNITLLNAAVSEGTGPAGMNIPKEEETGLDSYYEAHLTSGEAELSVMCIAIDSLGIFGRIKLIKIDVEGEEILALKGMKDLLRRDHPILIVEGVSGEVESYLRELGYSLEKAEGSPNGVFLYSREN